MERLCREHDLLRNDNGIVRVPFLIKGKLVPPPQLSREQIKAAFHPDDKDSTYAKLPAGQVIREPVIDRHTMKYTGEYIYQLMPPVSSRELIERDTDKLTKELYTLPVKDILDYLEKILSVLVTNRQIALQVLEASRLTSEYPDSFLDGWFGSLHSVFSREMAKQMIDNELSFGGMPGSRFLDDWVEVASKSIPGLVPDFAENLFGRDVPSACRDRKAYVRAMPTRQLHITAGNVPEVPLISALRAILTKSAAVIKLPYGATLPGALFSLAAAALPEHPITQNLSMVYWHGGDENIENDLFNCNAFERIVVWGSPEAVTSVRSRAQFTRVISLNPRFGVSLIGREAFSGNLEEAAVKASLDVMVFNQKACTSSLVHFVEGTEEQANLYAAALRNALAKWGEGMPNFIPPAAVGQVRRMRRGKYINAQWHMNQRGENYSSGVVVIPGEFDILDHPMCRLVVVRPVANLEDAVRRLNQFVSTAGVYPEARRLELRDRISARGVSSILPLGQCESTYAGMPHDDMLVLSELVDWKNA